MKELFDLKTMPFKLQNRLATATYHILLVLFIISVAYYIEICLYKKFKLNHSLVSFTYGIW